MLKAVMLWNEPNNLSHWDYSIDPQWATYALMRWARKRCAGRRKTSTVVLGGIAPIDPDFVGLVMDQHGLESELDVVAVHGFPFDWHLWQIEEWPARVAEVRAVTGRPIWATEVGVSSFGCEEVQALGLRKTVQLLPPWSTRSSGTPSSTCTRTARRRRATRRPRAPPTTATSTSACSPRAGRRAGPAPLPARSGDLPVAAPARPGAGAGHGYLAASASGCGRCAPASPGRTGTLPGRWSSTTS